MNQELQLGKYEFIPYEDEREKILKCLKDLPMTDEELEKRWQEMLGKFAKRKKKRAKKK